MIEQLLAEPAAGRRVSVVDTVEVYGAKTPIDMVGLDPVDLPLKSEDGLVDLKGVRDDPVRGWQIRMDGVGPVPGAVTQPCTSIRLSLSSCPNGPNSKAFCNGSSVGFAGVPIKG